MEGYISLKQAATELQRSVARTRQYCHDGLLTWVRDEMGRLQVSQESVAAFVPPRAGDSRASGVKASTYLRHLKGARKFITDKFHESDARRVTLEVIAKAIQSLGDAVAAEKQAAADAKAAKAAGGTPVVGGPAVAGVTVVAAEAVEGAEIDEDDYDFEGPLEL